MIAFRLIAAASLAFLSPAVAQPAAPAGAWVPPPPPQPPHLAAGRENAALLYYRTWDLLSREDSTAICDTFENSAKYHLTPEQVKVLESNQPHVRLLLQAANTPDCDWGIQYEQGWEALLPHLSKMRQSCRVLGADARRCLDAGDPGAAADRIAAIARMADQTRFDGILISALVGASMATYGANATDVAFELRALTPDSARTILNAFREIHQDDAFGSRSAIMFEAWSAVDWPRTRFTGATAGRDMIGLLGPPNESSGQTNAALSGLDADHLALELEKSRDYYDEALKDWDQPDAAARLEALGERVAKGEFGETAKVLVPAFGKARLGVDRGVERVNATIKELEMFIATGQTPADVAKAAAAPEGR